MTVPGSQPNHSSYPWTSKEHVKTSGFPRLGEESRPHSARPRRLVETWEQPPENIAMWKIHQTDHWTGNPGNQGYLRSAEGDFLCWQIHRWAFGGSYWAYWFLWANPMYSTFWYFVWDKQTFWLCKIKFCPAGWYWKWIWIKKCGSETATVECHCFFQIGDETNMVVCQFLRL